MTALLHKTLIVIPALNEEDSISEVITSVFKELPGVACLVVDDGSSDKTAEVSRRQGANVASLPYNLGVGGAMRLGFKFALQNGFENVVQVDADGQHNPADVLSLLRELEDADLVLGARFAGQGEYKVSGPRWWAMKSLAFFLSRSTGTTLTDTTSGFRASGPRAVKLFSELYPAEYLGDTVESLVIAARSGLKIKQVAVVMRERAAGAPSQTSLKSTLYLARVGIAMFFAFIRPNPQMDN
jgi:glycosyltransferase involved in cell wall biosynthesis